MIGIGQKYRVQVSGYPFLLTGNEDDCLTVEVLAKDFVKDLLEADPKKRCTAADALNHPVSRCLEFGLKQNADKLNDSG